MKHTEEKLKGHVAKTALKEAKLLEKQSKSQQGERKVSAQAVCLMSQ